MMQHEALCKAAEEAISAVHSDTSVSQRDTLHALRDLRDHASMLCEAVESDLREQEGGE